MTETVIQIDAGLAIPASELSFRASRSGGPGGQHVNTSASRVELIWDIDSSPSLTESQRERVREKLGSRITREGLLLMASSESRSQHRNRADVTRRFAELLRWALHVPKERKETRPPRASREARLRTKKQRSEVKQLRGRVRTD